MTANNKGTQEQEKRINDDSPSKIDIDNILEDLHGVMCATVFNFTPTFEFAREVAASDAELVEDGITSRFSDTVGRELVLNACSRFLLGEEWPKYYQNVDMVAFNKRLNEAYDENYR